jgi:hypothetical protein
LLIFGGHIFSEPEIDHFVMAITAAKARAWHIADYADCVFGPLNRGQMKMKYLIAAGMAVAISVAATGVFVDRPVAKQQIRPITLEQVHCAVYWDC